MQKVTLDLEQKSYALRAAMPEKVISDARAARSNLVNETLHPAPERDVAGKRSFLILCLQHHFQAVITIDELLSVALVASHEAEVHQIQMLSASERKLPGR
eukprot:Skav209572  [mRNA]  locus=scaffold281:138774:139142:- [translate_table: standard]